MLLRSRRRRCRDAAPRRAGGSLDNPRVLTVAALLLIAILAALFWLASRTSEIAPPLLTDVLLYALLAVDLALLAGALSSCSRAIC